MVKEVQLGKVEAELNEKILQYSNLIGLSKVDLIEELFYKEIEGKILTNTSFILEEVFYIDFKELLDKGEVKATKKRPNKNLNNISIIKRIVNNLDVFDKEKRTFCYNGVAEEHLGVYSYNKFILNAVKPKQVNLFQYYLLFEYNSGTEELIIRVTNPEDIIYYFDVAKVDGIISELNKFNKHFTKAVDEVNKLPEDVTLEDVLSTINLGLYLTSTLVIEPLAHAKSFSYGMFNSDSEKYERLKGKYSSSDLDLIIINEAEVQDTEEGTVKKLPDGVVNNG